MSRTMACAVTVFCASASLLGAQQQQSRPTAAATMVVYASSTQASYTKAPDSPIALAPLFGDANVDAPHGAFITFPPNLDAGRWHVHTNAVLYMHQAGMMDQKAAP